MTITNSVPQALFGPGILWVTRTDISGATPTNVGYVNEFSIDVSFENKDLYGQYQYPLVVARGTAKSTGKIKAATLSGQALNTLILGGTWTAGTQYDAEIVNGVVSTAAAHSFVPSIPSPGKFNKDLGVVFKQSGAPLLLGSSTPSAGQYYNTSSGKYVFNAAQSGSSVSVSLAYSSTAATGQSQTMQSNLIGTTPTFQLDYKTTLFGSTYYIRIFNAVSAKWSLGHKITDFAMPEYDFDFFANQSQQIGIISLATQA